MTHTNHIVQILHKKLSDSLSEEEEIIFNGWLNESSGNRDFFAELNDEGLLMSNVVDFEPARRSAVRSRILSRVHQQIQEDRSRSPVHFLRSRFFRAAAAVLIIMGACAYLWNLTEKKEKQLAATMRAVPADAPAGFNHAVLTLSDGTNVSLDAESTGNIHEGSLQIQKMGGALQYSPSGISVFNTIATPNGGQYRIVLADGTKVWLNAASSLKYPTAFPGKERRVELKGEGYFEVARNAEKVFKVYAPNGSVVQVLGTHFNVNTYLDEPVMTTTLLEGSVRVMVGAQMVMLTPGMQAIVDNNKHKSVQQQAADVEQVMAWKNGSFSFSNTEVSVLLRQLARWYDIEIVYSAHPSKEKVSGKIGRNLNLAEAVKVLNTAGIICHMENRRLIVTP